MGEGRFGVADRAAVPADLSRSASSQSSIPSAGAAYAWGVNAIKFIAERDLTTQFNDWCGGWKCPVTPEQIASAHSLKTALLELLAVIHRDGGHHTQAVGLEQSCADAMLLSSARIVAADAQAGDTQ